MLDSRGLAGPARIWCRTATLAAAICVAPTALSAQAQQDEPVTDEAVTLFGEVVDRRSGDPIRSARVGFLRTTDGRSLWTGEADDDGAFRTGPLPLGDHRVEVDAPPYSRMSVQLVLSDPGVADVRIEMVGVDFELEPIVALARRSDRLEAAGFYRRRDTGAGFQITRAEIEARNPGRATDLLRGVPSVRLDGGTSPGVDPRIYLRTRMSLLGGEPSTSGCIPLFVVDGSLARIEPPWGMDSLVSPENLEAIEVLTGTSRVPPQYAGLTNCGVVMLWTRNPSATGLSWLPTWRQALASAVLAALAIFATR